MTPDEFYMAQVLENETWQYVGTDAEGRVIFTRQINGITFTAKVSEER